MKIIDTHAHYDDKAFLNDKDDLLKNLEKDGIQCIINIGADLASCHNTLEMIEQYSNVYGALGIHPSETEALTERDISWLKEKAMHPKIVAIGEIGLDYYWNEPSRDIQKKWFLMQLDLAKEIRKPIVIHSRDAAKDTLDILMSSEYQDMSGIIHCYSYNKEIAKEYLSGNYYFGIGGVITFSNAKKLVEAVQYIPIDRIVLETDAPYLAPSPNRGKRNDSRNLIYVAEKIAEIKKIKIEEVIEITSQNAIQCYHLPL